MPLQKKSCQLPSFLKHRITPKIWLRRSGKLLYGAKTVITAHNIKYALGRHRLTSSSGLSGSTPRLRAIVAAMRLNTGAAHTPP